VRQACHGVRRPVSSVNGKAARCNRLCSRAGEEGNGVASVELRGLVKRYGPLAVVDNVSLTIEHGRLVCLLALPDCGKTTTTAADRRLVEPSAGRKFGVGEQIIILAEPHVAARGRRNIVDDLPELMRCGRT